jgi:hypothetical protein
MLQVGFGRVEAPQVRNKEQAWGSAGVELENRQERDSPREIAQYTGCFKKDKL